MEGVDAHDGALAVFEVAKAVEKVGDDNITSDESIGKDGVAIVLAGYLEGEHGLLLEVLQTHLLRLGDEFLLVELLLIVGHEPRDLGAAGLADLGGNKCLGRRREGRNTRGGDEEETGGVLHFGGRWLR